MDKIVTLSLAGAGDTVINLMLDKSRTGLGEVTVSAHKPLLERKIDRTIFNVSASITAIGGNALDAVRKSPGVLVKESDNTISIVGKSGAQVLVNGRLLQLSGEDLTAYLQAIPTENIDRIEVITTPPAQYDAAGNSGLINIVLKKSRAAGFNGNARLGYEQRAYANMVSGAALNYRRGRMNIYGNAGYNAGAKANVERMATYFPDQVFRLEDPYRKETAELQYTVGADYELTKKAVLGVLWSSTDNSRTDRFSTGIYVMNRSAGALDSVINTIGTTASDRNTKALNVNYVWTIDTTGRKLTINVNRLWFGSSRNRAYQSTNYSGLSQSPTGVSEADMNLGDQHVTITTAQADAELPYKWASLSFGGKASFVDNGSSSDFLYFANGVYNNNPAISNAFSYKEAVQALYANVQKTAGKWSFQVGLRAEATQTEGYSRNLSQTNKAHYLDLFPTAYIEWKPGEAHVLNLTYSRRINRPGYADLNPFRLYTSPYSYTEGNPFLQPSYNHNLELSYTLRQKYTFTAYYQLEMSHFGQVFAADTVAKTSYVTLANFGDFHGYGLTISASWQPTKWWEVQAVANGGVQQISTGAADQSYGLPNVYFSANNSFTLNKRKTLLAEINAFYLSRYQQDLFYYDGIANVDTGIKALLLDKKLAVSLSATDIFASQRFRGTNQVTGQMLDSYFDTRSLRLMLNYKFGSDKVKAQRERSTGVEEEKRRT